MKLSNYLLVAIFLGVCLVSAAAQADTTAPKWTAGPWQSQGMISWGADTLVVDFGPNGLWNYNGSWIRLSNWDPQSMVTWGEGTSSPGAGRLAVDFGVHGLWNYDGSSWRKIALGTF